MALEMRDSCERCGTATPPTGTAFICSFECTWCSDCVDTFPGRACPNCGGDLQRRPSRRPAA
ncbi:hypothetical protein CLV49_1973 [Labedella gwakjiensis]|uniref:DUF1272 domain-containing protein n=1 Tax=Labedella gwakjiensis TaxID=390269 RepID=A0A2P8GWM1_9MICO|nr:DUF1272 domain-containing protein [Labedella gwakjiensis]PSL38352.1 hypothetical protein CLV49_1973 [Labedella gwakjiensis]RUQ87117.1 DUF1272 domain-containing protein [Labedella gwakjiensis]